MQSSKELNKAGSPLTHTNLLFSKSNSIFSIENVTISNISENEYDEVERLRQAHLREENVESSPIGINLKKYSSNNEHKRFNVMVAKFNDKVIAYSIYSFQYSTLNDNCSLFVSDLYVSPEYRKQGIAKKIIEQLSSKNDCYQLSWKALKTNETAIQIYTNSGALIDSENERCIAFKLPSDRNTFKLKHAS